jgi:hypothetical protein
LVRGRPNSHHTLRIPFANTLPPNTSLQLTRLAGRKRMGAWPAGLRDNGSSVARAAGQLSSQPFGGSSRAQSDDPRGPPAIDCPSPLDLL